MKKTVPFVMCILVLCLPFTISACSISERNEKSANTAKDKSEILLVQKNSEYTIDDFMPQKLNSKLTFSGGFENGGETSCIEKIKGNRVQMRTVNDGTTTVTVLEKRDNNLVIVFRQAEAYEKKDVIDQTSKYTEIYLKGPLQIGTSWKADDGTIKTITSISAEIKTEAGIFKCIEVTSKNKDFVCKEYFAPKLGRILSVFTTGTTEFKTEIKSVQLAE